VAVAGGGDSGRGRPGLRTWSSDPAQPAPPWLNSIIHCWVLATCAHPSACRATGLPSGGLGEHSEHRPQRAGLVKAWLRPWPQAYSMSPFTGRRSRKDLACTMEASAYQKNSPPAAPGH
jgi:hypothetical protein